MSFIKKKHGIEQADLDALEISFTDDDEVTELHLTPKRTVRTPQKSILRSPIKAHIQQFMNDFEDDLTEESDEELNMLLVQKTLFPSPHKKATGSPNKSLVSVSTRINTLDESTKKIKLSQQSSMISITKKPKLDDLEDIFKDEFSDDSLEKSVDRISISAVETSSPTYHRTETIVKRIPIAENQNEIKNRLLTSSFLKSTSDLGDPLVSSTQNDQHLYPKMDSYNEKYPIPRPIALIVPDKHVLQMSATSERVPLCPSRDFFDLTDRKEESQPIKPLIQRQRDTRGNSITRQISSLLNVPRQQSSKQNSELLLLTQRPTPFDSHQQTRSLSTAAPTSNSLEKLHQQKIKTVQAFSLSEEQTHVRDLVLQGKSIFYTGSAGTGKSVLLRSIIKALREKFNRGEVAVTASTGLAAVNIGGITLHSFAGIGLGKDPTDMLIKKVKRGRSSRERWKNTSVLIIDEVSMISGELFDKLDAIGKNVRGNHYAPFGGIQIVACGDFFQLPPVTKQDEGQVLQFCFDSKAWRACMDLTITLKQVFRQQSDTEFIEMLNDMRLGKVTNESWKKFLELERELPASDIEPAELYATRGEVERANDTRLKRINSKAFSFKAIDSGILTDEKSRTRMLSNFMAPENLELKKDAQVMLIKNMDETLVNGSLGRVIDFMDSATYLTYEKLIKDSNYDSKNLERELEKIEISKKELAVLKNNGFGPLEEESDEVVEDELEDTVFGFMNEIETQDEEVLANIKKKKELMNRIHKSSKGNRLPLVRFLTPSGQYRYVLVNQETWTVDDENQQPLVSRHQLPLILAWALSIHKSQGQTLPRVRVNLKRIFEKGQAYVAISRAVSREGLQVLNFTKDKVFAHPRVKEFYNGLRSVDEYLSTLKPRPEAIPQFVEPVLVIQKQGEIMENKVNRNQNIEPAAKYDLSRPNEDELVVIEEEHDDREVMNDDYAYSSDENSINSFCVPDDVEEYMSDDNFYDALSDNGSGPDHSGFEDDSQEQFILPKRKQRRKAQTNIILDREIDDSETTISKY